MSAHSQNARSPNRLKRSRTGTDALCAQAPRRRAGAGTTRQTHSDEQRRAARRAARDRPASPNAQRADVEPRDHVTSPSQPLRSLGGALPASPPSGFSCALERDVDLEALLAAWLRDGAPPCPVVGLLAGVAAFGRLLALGLLVAQPDQVLVVVGGVLVPRAVLQHGEVGGRPIPRSACLVDAVSL